MFNSISRLLKLSEFMSPDAANAINLQSLLTLVVENLHATTKMKHPAPSLLDYFGEFGKGMRESITEATKKLAANNKIFSWHIAHVSIRARPTTRWLRKSLQEVTEGEEEEIIEEYESDSDSSLSLSHLSEDDDEESDALVPSILTTRNGRQIRAVVRLDL
ncbi:hypothetical protein ACROYT_G041870 [Oculina patagonica]